MVDILVVDDKPAQLLAIKTVLEGLGENVVLAASGKEALMRVLDQAFALILLDISMPGMDGFETAELIRGHRPSRQTPIIFMTASSDEALVAKSYSFGATDCISKPFVPEVLRSKVRVFADLFRVSEQLRDQAAIVAQRASRMARLAQMSLAIHATVSLDGMLQAIADAAREILDAHQAIALLELAPIGARVAASFSDDHAASRGPRSPLSLAGYREFAVQMRHGALFTRRELEERPHLQVADTIAAAPPWRGLLAAPLTERDESAMGMILVSDKREGDLVEADEAILRELAQVGSVAIRNSMLAEAREANRLKDELLATLSHELRTPLSAILGWARIFRKGPLTQERMERGLDVIERNVNVQTAMIEELIDVSQLAAGKLRIDAQPQVLGAVVEGALETLRPAAAAKGITVDVDLGGGARVLGDASRLHRVAFNLIGNAIKFTPKGGRVEIVVRSARGEVDLFVADSGVGIDPEFLPYVFDSFRQADGSVRRAHGGLGLGLAVVRQLVELHGGSVSAESAGIDRGASFLVRLPELAADRVFEQPAAPVSERTRARETRPEPAGGPTSGVQTLDGLRVLVVEDDDDVRSLLAELLSQHDADVTTATSVAEALDALEARRPHVLVSDIAMCGEDGYSLIRRVRARLPHEGGRVPAIALTALTRHEDRARALEAGFQMHAAKPIDPTKLIEAVVSLASSSDS